MSQRIRYVKKGNVLISVSDVISKKGSKYSVTIDLTDMTYVIKNTLSNRKYKGGEDINNLNVLKRKIKTHLKHLGVEFEKERRKRTFGKCEKGYNQEKHLKETNKQTEQNSSEQKEGEQNVRN